MSSINDYESLKENGTSAERIKYFLSLKDKNPIEIYLKEKSTKDFDDLQTFINLSKLTKNSRNLFEIFQNDQFPTKQRSYAGKCWIHLQNDSKQIENFIFQTINDKNIPRYIKFQILKNLHRTNVLKKSPSFFYDLACRLTEIHHHDEYNIDIHLLPYCSINQIKELLSRWSIKRFEEIKSLSIFYFKILNSHPLILIDLIKEDLNFYKTNLEKFLNYFEENLQIIKSISEKVPKELICLIIEYLNQLEKHQRLLPSIIHEKQKYFFKKVPKEMIQLITIVGANQKGSIKYKSRWNPKGEDLGSFLFPRSFSIENYVDLFFSLYERCSWSSNHTIKLLQYLLATQSADKSLSSIKKQRKWFFDIIVNQRIGFDLFLKKLLKEGNEDILRLFENYPELSNPLSIHLFNKFQEKEIVSPAKHLSLLRYQIMTDDLFQQFLSLFKQTGSDVSQRQLNYPILLQCAVYTNQLFATNVIQFIEKRFTNEQIIVVEHFLSNLSSFDDRFHLQILPKNFHSIENIFNIAINHLQQSNNTLSIIINYAKILLQQVEHYQNKEDKQNIQQFAINSIKQCLSKSDFIPSNLLDIDECYPETRDILVNIIVNHSFPKFLSKSLVDEINSLLPNKQNRFWQLPEIDSFLDKFFSETLLSSSKIQSEFKIDQHLTMIKFYLRNPTTKSERIKHLINNIDQRFFIDKTVQRIVLRSQQYRSFIDNLIEDEKSVTLDKLINQQTKFSFSLNSETKRMKLPGLNIEILNDSSQYLTGKQQQHITNLILNDYLQDGDVSNRDKLKSLRILRRLPSTYNKTLEWINTQEDDSLLLIKNSSGNSYARRGANAQPLDDILICLPATFDLNRQILLKHFDYLKEKINATNAKFLSDAMLNISRKVPDQIFLEKYLEFIRNEQFRTLGVTANKEILRLLNEYVNDSSLVENLIKPYWNNRPHQDVRAAIILILLNFIVKTNSTEDQTAIWNILLEAADDEYLPVVQTLFSAQRGSSRWPLTKLKNSSNPIFERFVNQIQFKILDHPTSLEARSFAWNNIDYKYVDTNQLIEKAKQIFIQFDKNANQLWQTAFDKIICLFKEQIISSIDTIIDIIKLIMSRREDIDSQENALDHQHDLPVYHRIQRILTNLNSNINQFDNEKKLQFRSLTPIILQFDLTLAPQISTLLIAIAQNKEDLEDVLNTLQKNLNQNYFYNILIHLATFISNDDHCPFIQQLNVDEKLQLAQWFIKEKNRPLFVFDLLKNHVFNQSGLDLPTCQDLIRQIRQNDDLFLRQQAIEYTVPWNEDGTSNNDQDDNGGGDNDDNDEQMSVSEDSDMS